MVEEESFNDALYASVDPVDQALADLALSAVATLRNQMHMAKQPKDKIAAANSILDRLGYGRATRAQAEVADREIRNALEAAARSAGETKRAVEGQSEPIVPPDAVILGPAHDMPPLRPVDDLDPEDDEW